MAQWVKNLTADTRVNAEAWVRFPAQHGGLKDLALPLLQCRLQLWLGFNPWPGNFHMLWVWLLKKKKCVLTRLLFLNRLVSVLESKDH